MGNFFNLEDINIDVLREITYKSLQMDWCVGESLGDFYNRLKKAETDWISQYNEDEDGSINEYIDLFWDNDGDVYRQKMLNHYIPLLAKLAIVVGNCKLVDKGCDVDLMQIYLTFRKDVTFSEYGLDCMISAWAKKTGLDEIDFISWDGTDHGDSFDVCIWVPWRNE